MRTATLLFVAMVCAGCGPGDATPTTDATPATTTTTIVAADSGAFASLPRGWTRLPDAPLLPRTDATVVWTGAEIIVAGGWDFACPPNADCAPSVGAAYADGAAYDPTTATWRRIADAPVAFKSSEGLAIAGDVYVLVNCLTNDCGEANRLLRYRPTADAWDTFGFPEDGNFSLAPGTSEPVAYAESDEQGPGHDWRFDITSGEWHPLPDAPLPDLYDRQLVGYEGDYLLFGTALVGDGEANPPVLGARFDTAADTWEEMPATTVSGYRAWLVDGRVVFNPHFRDRAGGILDLGSDAWSPLPDPPSSVDEWRNDLAGVVASETAVYASPSGWVLDLERRTWIEIQQLDAPFDRAFSAGIAAVGRDLFLFGGDRWRPLNDAWVWRPPP